MIINDKSSLKNVDMFSIFKAFYIGIKENLNLSKDKKHIQENMTRIAE